MLPKLRHVVAGGLGEHVLGPVRVAAVDADAAILLEVHWTHRRAALVAGVLGLPTFAHLTEARDAHTRGYDPHTLHSRGRASPDL